MSPLQDPAVASYQWQPYEALPRPAPFGFDVWLQNDLARQASGVLREPIPGALMDLLEGVS